MQDFLSGLRYNVPPPVRKLKRGIIMEQLEKELRALTSADRVRLIRFLRILRDSEDSESPPTSSDQADPKSDQ